MPELRKDFLTDALVAIAEERGDRPHFYKHENIDLSGDNCPFCPENNNMTPKETYISKDGRVRVVPNKYPAFSIKSGEYGFHEVIIDTPEHDEKFKDFSINDIFTVFYAIRERLDTYFTNKRIKYVQIIKNDGRNAGASIFHSHWQLFALDFLPNIQKKIHSNLNKYSKTLSTCFLCDIKKSEGLLKICENELFMAYSPYASMYTHMVQIIPNNHVRDFKDFDDKHLLALAEILKKILNALEILNPGLSYNICFQNTPYNMKEEKYKSGHFFIQVIPRIGNLAGFEFSTGCYISMVKPENSCESLKKIIMDL